MVLTAATRLFREHGYHATSIAAIAEAAGIAAPSFYRHFAGKSDVLLAALTRGSEQLAAAASEALASTGSPQDRLDRLVRSYVGVACRYRDLVVVYLTEAHNLPADQQRVIRRRLRDYVDEWARALAAARPGLRDDEYRLTAQAGITSANEVVRSGRFQHRPGLEDELTALVLRALLA